MEYFLYLFEYKYKNRSYNHARSSKRKFDPWQRVLFTMF